MSDGGTSTQPVRTPLPGRRPSVTLRVEAGGLAAHTTVGYDPVSGAPREVFLRPSGGAKSGSTVEAICDDVSVIISVALQHGVAVEALARSIGRSAEGEPASIAGAALVLLTDEAATWREPGLFDDGLCPRPPPPPGTGSKTGE